jgi:hypothetical protein
VPPDDDDKGSQQAIDAKPMQLRPSHRRQCPTDGKVADDEGNEDAKHDSDAACRQGGDVLRFQQIRPQDGGDADEEGKPPRFFPSQPAKQTRRYRRPRP